MLKRILLSLVVLVTIFGVASASRLPLLTGPGGKNPVHFPAVLEDLNNLISQLNISLAAFDDTSGPSVPPGPIAASSLLVGGAYTQAGVQLTDGEQVALQVDSQGRLITTGSFTATTTIATGATLSVLQSTSPWVDNVSQFGGSNVVTGTGASGAGIPRVTVANDSNVLVNGQAASGGADAGNPIKVGGIHLTTPPTFGNSQIGNLQIDTAGNLMVNIQAGASASSNITQFGGSNVQTGIGASGVGIPRVSISNDSAVIAGGNVASASTDLGNPVKVGGVFRTSAPTFTNGQRSDLQVDTNGNLKVNLAVGSISSSVIATGDSASGGADSGSNPLKIGGVYNTTLPTFTNGQRGNVQIDSHGDLNVVTQATENHIGSVGGQNVRVNSTPTVQNAAYASGNCIGGFNAVTLARVNGGSGILDAVMVKSVGGGGETLTVYLFDANPTASTCTDKSTFTLNAADSDKLIATPFALQLGVPTGTSTTFAELTNMVRMFIAGGSTASGVRTIYYALVSGSTFTPATTTDIRVNIQANLD